jgi:putative salt-induced outer membrane protein YdiY
MRLAPTLILVLATLAGAARADEVKLTTGETLKGTIVSRDESGVVMDHPVLGRITIPAAQVEPPAPPPPPPSPWKVKAELGAAGSSGNTDQSDLHAAIAVLHETDTGRLKAGGGWATSETDDEKTKDQQYVEATYDFLFRDSPWSVFVTGRMDWDDFQDWDRRASVGGGAGYLLVDEKDVKLRLRAGLVGTREWGSSDEDREDWRPEGLLGAEAAWQVDERNSVEAKSTYYPDFDESGEFRIVSTASWSIRLTEDKSLSLKLGLEHEYDSHNEEPYDTTDFRYFVALLYEF